MPNPLLYFIAIVPDEALRGRVKVLKEEMRDAHGPKHALKSPAHVTLQKPFKRDESEEGRMSEALRRFAARQKPFPVQIDGFGSFAPRVLYLKVTPHAPMRELHVGLVGILRDELGFGDAELSREIHPHMTIATRDLDETTFREAWPRYEHRGFEAEFEVNGVWLLRHNGRAWDLFRFFPFTTSTPP